MKIKSLQTLALATLAGFSLTARGADDPDQSEFPQIMSQPTDQAVLAGDSALLSVQATNADGFQWLRNGVPIDGETNSSLNLVSVGTNDASLYSCSVLKGSEVVPTRSASVNVLVATANNQFVVYATPVVSSGSKSTCPGAYAGYVNYTKTVAQGWGWAPSTAPHTASDGSGRTDTKVEYLGKNGDSGCNQTSVTVHDPTGSPKYRFTIYFPSNVPTGSYPINLSGFNP